MMIQSYRFHEISKLIYPIKFKGVALFFQMKLLREVTWQILSHCDGWAVKKLIEKEERPAATVLRLCSERIFEKNVKEISLWKTCYQICRDAYLSMKPEFEIRTDKFGGYCLVYVCHVVRSKGYIFKNSPVGFLKPIPPDITDLSVITRSSSGQEMLLLGPVRFINSDCDPNCEFDFTSDDNIVRIRTRRKVKPGDEINVKYSENFFEYNECRCSTCSAKLLTEAEVNSYVVEENMSCLEYDNLPSTASVALPDATVPFSPSNVENLSRKHHRCSKLATLKNYEELTKGADEINFAVSDGTSTDELSSTTDEDSYTEEIDAKCSMSPLHDPCFPEVIAKVSSPVTERTFLSPHFSSSFSSIQDEVPKYSSEERSFTPLYEGASVGVTNSIAAIEGFCSSFHLSDVGACSFLKLKV